MKKNIKISPIFAKNPNICNIFYHTESLRTKNAMGIINSYRRKCWHKKGENMDNLDFQCGLNFTFDHHRLIIFFGKENVKTRITPKSLNIYRVWMWSLLPITGQKTGQCSLGLLDLKSWRYHHVCLVNVKVYSQTFSFPLHAFSNQIEGKTEALFFKELW